MTIYSPPLVHESPPESILADPRYRAYQPYGSALKLFYDQSDEILICGPAGTGKSRAALEKMHFCCMKYPGMRGLMIRKTRESLTQSAMVTYTKHVVPDNNSVKFRTQEQEYRYTNSSIIAIGGLDKSSKVLSSEYDMIYVQEATEITEDDLEILNTRARNGVMPYNQVIMDCNPGPSHHWLLKRRDDGILKYIVSLHKDNPTLFDQETGELTPRGEAYIGKLMNLTGVRRKRLYEGLWVSAEGMIYEEEWNSEKHLINWFKPPYSWPRYWSVDFGFRHPLVIQVWAHDSEHDISYRFAELYMTGMLVEDAARELKKWKRLEKEPNPRAILCDWNAEDRATLERHLGLDTEPAEKDVLTGIETVKSLMREDRLLFMRDSSIQVDYQLQEDGKPWRTEDEIEGYVWDDKKTKEQPVKEEDDGMDCLRYYAKHIAVDDAWTLGMVS